MQNRQLQLLFHPVFFISLLILLVNDFYLKPELHNWFTGKLSDFSGLLAFTIFFSAFFYTRRLIICLCVATLFIWWKSSLSQPMIEFLAYNNIPIGRTVDYSDLIALPAIVLSLLIKPQKERLLLLQPILKVAICIISFFAFTATSYYRKFSIRPDLGNTIDYTRTYKTRFTKEEILQKLESFGIRYSIDSFTVAPLRFYGGSLIIETKDSVEENKIIIDADRKDTSVFFRINEMPFIEILNLSVGEDIIPKIRIRTYRNLKSNTIILESINPGEKYYDEYLRHSNKTKKRVQRLVENGLIKKLM